MAPLRRGQRQHQDDENEDPPLTRDAVGELVNEAVNKALGAQLGRKLDTVIGKAIETALAARGGKGAPAGEGEEQPETEKPKPRAAAGAEAQPKSLREDPEYLKLKGEVDKMREERVKERQMLRERERDSTIREQLEAAGVEKNRLRGAIAVVREGLTYDEKAQTWVGKINRDGIEDEADIAGVVGHWTATDEGKSYVAPPANQRQPQRTGSGVRPQPAGMGVTRPTAAVDPKAAKVQRQQQAVNDLEAAVAAMVGGAGVEI